MHKLITTLLILSILFFCFSNIAISESKVGKINTYEITDMVRDIVLSKPVNAELKEKYLQYKEKEKEKMQKFDQAMNSSLKEGHLTIPLEEEDTSELLEVFSIEKLVQEEIALLVEKNFGNDYDVVLDGGRTHYSKVPIVDLTEELKVILRGKKDT